MLHYLLQCGARPNLGSGVTPPMATLYAQTLGGGHAAFTLLAASSAAQRSEEDAFLPSAPDVDSERIALMARHVLVEN